MAWGVEMVAQALIYIKELTSDLIQTSDFGRSNHNNRPSSLVLLSQSFSPQRFQPLKAAFIIPVYTSFSREDLASAQQAFKIEI